MLHDVRAGLTEAVVIGPGRAVLFYGRHSLEEGLTTDEARDAAFLLTGVGMWVGTSLPHCQSHDNSRRSTGNYQSCNRPPSKGKRARTPHVNPSTQQPFRFDCTKGSPIKNTSGEVDSDHRPLPHWPPRGQDCNRHWRDQRPPLLQLPLPSPDCGFETN